MRTSGRTDAAGRPHHPNLAQEPDFLVNAQEIGGSVVKTRVRKEGKGRGRGSRYGGYGIRGGIGEKWETRQGRGLG